MTTRKCTDGPCKRSKSSKNNAFRRKRSSSRKRGGRSSRKRGGRSSRKRGGSSEEKEEKALKGLKDPDELVTGLGLSSSHKMEMETELPHGMEELPHGMERSSPQPRVIRRGSPRGTITWNEMKMSSPSETKAEMVKRDRESSEGEERESRDGKTPRTKYAEKHFEDNKQRIHLLGEHDEKEPYDYDGKYVVFQVPYNDVRQFTKYENLDLNHDPHKKDCAIQSMFSLGLQDVELSKQCSSDINMNGKEGITRQTINDYIKSAFGLSSETQVMRKRIDMRDVTYDGDDEDGNYDVDYYHYKHNGTEPSIEGYNFYLDENLTPEQKNGKTVEFFDRKLKNGYATTISIMFSSSRGNEFGHRLVVYKHKNNIYFFDPQQKLSGLPVKYNASKKKYCVVNPNGEHTVYISQNLYDLIPSRSSLDSVYCIIIRNLPEETKPLIKTDMPFDYVKKK